MRKVINKKFFFFVKNCLALDFFGILNMQGIFYAAAGLNLILHAPCQVMDAFPRGSGAESDNGNRHMVFTYFSPHARGRINSSGRLLSAALFFLLTKNSAY